MRMIKDNMLFISVAIMVTAVFSYLFWPTSPFDQYESVLEKVEQRLKGRQFEKSTQTLIVAIKKASKNADYAAMTSAEWEQAQNAKSTGIIREIQEKTKALRSFEEMEDTPSQRSKLTHAVTEFNVARKKFGQWQTDERKTWKFIAEALEERQSLVATLNKQRGDFEVQRIVTFAAIAKMAKKYPHQVKRLNEMKAQLETFDAKYGEVIAFYSQKEMPLDIESYVAIKGVYDRYELDGVTPHTTARKYKEMVDKLDETYVKVLIEDEEQHSVKIAGVTWDNYYDYPTEHSMSFPYVNVSRKAKLSIMGEFGSGRQLYESAAKSNLNLRIATKNGIATAKWDSGDDEGEFWVEDDESEYTHLYQIITGDEKIEVEEDVSLEVFVKHQNSKGKAILSKPLGAFEDEVIDMVTEPGLAFVGNSHYGSWQQSSSGGSMWVWLPMYTNFGSSHYYDSDYNRYRNSYKNYTPIRSRSNYRSSKFGVVDSGKYSGGVTSNGYKGGNALRSSGSSTRNMGPGKGK